MYKKFNHYLLTHYPLVWNLKLPWIILLALLVNLTAFLTGYMHVSSKIILQETWLKDTFFRENYFMVFFMIIVLSIIVWIRFYIKNNRFKSGYPTSRNYLYKEFLGVLTVFLIFTFVPNSFESGVKTRISSFISDQDYAADVDLINKSQAFTLHASNGYSNNSRNQPVPLFDNLVKEAEVFEAFQLRQLALAQEYPTRTTEEFLTPYFRNVDFENLLIHHFPDRLQRKQVVTSSNYNSYNSPKSNRYTGEEAMAMAVEANEEDEEGNYINLGSLYNFSAISFFVPNDSTKNQMHYDKQLIQLLAKNDKSAIQKQLNQYLKLLDKFQIGHRFTQKAMMDYVPNPPYYFIDFHIPTEGQYYENGVTKYGDYINTPALIDVYTNFEYAKYESTFFKYFSINLMIALVCTLLLITFRFSSFKVWLISVIGSGVVSIIGVCIGLLIAVSTSTTYLPYIVCFGFYILFIGLFLFLLRLKERKIIAGVALNWFVWSSAFILLLFVSFLSDVYSDIYRNNDEINYYETLYSDPTYIKLQQLSELMIWINPLMLILGFYIIIQFYRKWQALPEE